MPSIFVSVIVRVVPGGLDLEQVIASIQCQALCKQIIVVNDGPEHARITDARHLASREVLVIEISKPVGDRAFTIGGQLASYEACLLWCSDQLMPEGLCAALHQHWDETKLVGMRGRRLLGAERWASAPIYGTVDTITRVEHLDPHGLLVHQKMLQLPFDQYYEDVGMSLCAHAVNRFGASCFVVPLGGHPGASKAAENLPADRQHANTMELAYTNIYLNYGRRHKDWPEINERVLPYLPQGSLLKQLSDSYHNVVVLGCQRSGTTWFAKCLGSYITDAAPLDENQSFNVLLDGHRLPALQARYLVYQTTFSGHDASSYESAPANTSLVLMLRNPFSVSYSLLYNFQLLDIVYRYRSASMVEADYVDAGDTQLNMVLAMYRQSMRAAHHIMQTAKDRLLVVEYDQAVKDIEQTLARAAAFLGADGVEPLPAALVEQQPRRKREQLPQACVDQIERYASEPYLEVVNQARQLGLLDSST